MNDTACSPSEVSLDRIRSARRHQMPLAVRVRIEAQGDGVELVCADISRTGAFLRSDVLFEVGTPLWCDFEWPDGHRFGTRAEVARVDTAASRGRCGMGVQFERPCELLPGF